MKLLLQLCVLLPAIFFLPKAVLANSYKAIYESISDQKIKKFGFSQDGGYFYALEADGEVRIWDVVSNKLVTTLTSGSIEEVFWSRNPTRIYRTGKTDSIKVTNPKSLNSNTVAFSDPGEGPSIISGSTRYLMKGTEIWDTVRKTSYPITGVDYKVYQYPHRLSVSDDSNTVLISVLEPGGSVQLEFIDLHTGLHKTSWSPMWLFGGNIIKAEMMRDSIVAIGMDNKEIKLWSYTRQENIGTLFVDEKIQGLKRDQKKEIERLLAWGDTNLNVWESTDWTNSNAKKIIKHEGATGIRHPSISYDGKWVVFTDDAKSRLRIKSVVETSGDEVPGKEFINETQGYFSPIGSYLLTLNDSQNKLTLWNVLP